MGGKKGDGCSRGDMGADKKPWDGDGSLAETVRWFFGVNMGDILWGF
jgi:hypothetical protein